MLLQNYSINFIICGIICHISGILNNFKTDNKINRFHDIIVLEVIVMNKNIMLFKIKKYLANKFECDISELDKKGLNIIKNNKDYKLKMLLLYDLVLVSCSNNLYDLVKERLNGKNIYEIFEFPLAYGQSIYFVPDLERISK